jgi:hypothetical protein
LKNWFVIVELIQLLDSFSLFGAFLVFQLSLLNDGRISDSDKLRCALLYALRYESVRNELPTIKQLLRSKARDANARSRVELVDLLLEYSNSASRGSDLFAQSVAAKASKFFELFSSDFQVPQSLWGLLFSSGLIWIVLFPGC